jgi:hypothetical protein
MHLAYAYWLAMAQWSAISIPVFQRTDVGTPEFDSSSWSTASILLDVSAVYTAFCFSDGEASQFPTPEECYHFLSDDECVCSFLACAKLIRGAEPVMREPIFGEPVLTVIHAPAVALAGKSILGEEVWLNVPSSPLLVGDGLMVRYIHSCFSTYRCLRPGV